MIDKQTKQMITAKDFIEQAHEYSKGKVCGKCKEHKLFSEFCKDRSRKNGLKYECKSCAKENQDNVCPFKKWFSHKKSHAKKTSIKFTIEPEDIPGVKIRKTTLIDIRGKKHYSWEGVQYPKVCPVYKTSLDWGMNGCNNNSPSLDRDNPKLGYIPGNVMMMSNLANKMKNNATHEQLKQFSEYHLSHQPLHTNSNQLELF